ncbi:hypothetical protein ACJU26_09280 [Acidithiobacillus sp. M4-SHS-6]|uniref:hypothetical protein n=1 Tax=Acidithiobacillus sp. M4-SHS-6 TaxID=3383024 RepID=UPI0039BE7BC0
MKHVFRVVVGEWNEDAGQYVVAEDGNTRHAVKLDSSHQGVVLTLCSPDKADVDIYLERVKDAWRLNVTRDADIVSQVVITDDDVFLV